MRNRLTTDEVINALTYRAYRDARDRSPMIEVRRWAHVFGAETHALEARYQQDARTVAPKETPCAVQ